MPTRAEKSRVRAVIYQRSRMRRLHVELSSIDVLMNTRSSPPLGRDDVRYAAGAGPTWINSENAAVMSSVLEAADRCDAVARLLQSIRTALAGVDIPSGDRRRLRAAYAAQAAAWRERGAAWRAPQKPDAEHAAARIDAHERAALRHLRGVRGYLKKIDPEDYA